MPSQLISLRKNLVCSGADGFRFEHICLASSCQRVCWSWWYISNLTLTLHGAAAALLEILRQAVDTRKTALVEVALDLIQRLIAHQALQVNPTLGRQSAQCC